MGGLNMLLGLARKEIFADRAIAVAPAILPLDLPHGRLSGPLKKAWIKSTRITGADRGIKYVNDWDYSQNPPTDEWLDKNAYARNPPLIRQAWQMLQHPGDMLRPGLPTARRVAHLFDSTGEASMLPANSIKIPISLIQAKDDVVVCNDTARVVCSRIAPNVTTVTLPEPHTLELAPPAAIKAIAQEIADGLVSFPRRGVQNWGNIHGRHLGYTPSESHRRSERRAQPGLAA
jgi:hypothetical protein